MKKLKFFIFYYTILSATSKTHYYLKENDYLKHNYVSFSVGPGLETENSLEHATVLADTTLIRNTHFRIKHATGPTLSLDAYFHFNRYIAPYVDFGYASLRTGFGYLNVFDSRNGEKVSTIEFHTFNPEIISKSLLVANKIFLKVTEFFGKELMITLDLGYALKKQTIKADLSGDTSTSTTTWKGFAGGLLFYYDINSKLELTLFDYVFPDRITIISTRDSFEGDDSGTETFIFFRNSIITEFRYQLKEHIKLYVAGEWSYAKNVGKSSIILTRQDNQILKDPKLCYFTSNSLALQFGILYSF